MVSIVADNRDIERCIESNIALAAQCGAAFAEDMVVRCAGGNLSVHTGAGGHGNGLLLRLPKSALAPLSHFTLSVSGDDIVIAAAAAGTPHTKRMEAMLEVYNLTGKLLFHRTMSSWMFLTGCPALLQPILRGRNGPVVKLLCDRIASGDTEKMAMNTLLKSRTITLDSGKTAEDRAVFMPVADFINHTFHAPPFLFPRTSAGVGIAIRRAVSQHAENECFVHYGPYDCFDTWLNYNFVDESAPVARSVPVDIAVPGAGMIRVNAQAKPGKLEGLPPHLADLRGFIPDMTAQGSDVVMPFLLIPGPTAPMALRRVLGAVIALMRPGHAGNDGLVEQAEDQVIAANQAYYRDLQTAVKSLAPAGGILTPAAEGLLRVCDRQLTHLEAYRTGLAERLLVAAGV